MRKKFQTKFLVLVATICSLNSVSSLAAENSEKKFYIGTGYQFNKTDFKTVTLNVSNGSVTYQGDQIFEKNYNNLSFFAGYQLDENLDLELSYFRKNNQNLQNNNTGLTWQSSGNAVNANISSDLQVVSLDGIFNHELTQDNKLKLLGLAGLSVVKHSAQITYFDGNSVGLSDSYSNTSTGLNFGLGLEYEILPNINLRGLAKVTKLGGSRSGYINYIASYNLGIKYGF